MLKKTKSRLRDAFLVIICLSVCGYFVNLFLKDLNSSTTRKDIDQIGTIYFKYKIAQRKFSDRVVWERLQQNSPLYNADTIRTADSAMANITFLDGTKIELSENTMLQIFYSEEGVQLSVGGGDIDVDTTASSSDSSVSVKMENGSSLKLDSGSRLVASTNQMGDNAFNLKAGKADVVNEKGETQEISTGETVKVEKSGKITKAPLTVTSISSDTKLLAYENEKKSVELKWNVSEAAEEEKIVVQTSLTKDFSKILGTFEVSGSDFLDVDVDKGTVYWRIFQEDKKIEEQTEPVQGKITVLNMEKIQVTEPANGATYRYRKGKELPRIAFKWNGDSYVTNYNFELSDSRNFTNVIYNGEYKNSFATLQNLDAGTYYWRVTPYYSINDTGYGESSAVMSFSVVQDEKLPPPVLSLPVANASITLSEKVSDIQFKWKANVDDADYKLLLSKDNQFEQIVYTEETSANKAVHNADINLLPEGTYYWKVIRESAEDSEPAESKTRSFKVVKYVPGQNKLMYPPENYSVEMGALGKLAFSWKLSDDYKGKSSIFQISKDSDFKTVEQTIKSDTASVEKLKLPAGNYYWRVAVTDDLSGLVVTEPRQINIMDSLKDPRIIYPSNNQKLIQPAGSVVNISWTLVENADYYKVKVYDASGKLVKDLPSIRESHITVNDLMPEDTDNSIEKQFRCTVQAFVEESDISQARSGKAVTVDFSVREPERIKLVSPAVDTKVNGLAAVQKTVDFTWNVGDAPKTSTFELRKLSANGTSRVIKSIENPSVPVKIERLTDGKYQWTVKASLEDGTDVSPINNGTFTVTPIPELAKAVLVEPSAGLVIGPEYLRKNRNLSFNWKAVSGATDYVFVLYQKTSDGKLKKIVENSGKNTGFKLKDLSILDVGEFEWNVTAYAHAKDGFVEQKSRAAAGNFKISFDLPSKVETIDVGRQYGE